MGGHDMRALYHQDVIDSQFNPVKFLLFLRQDDVLKIDSERVTFNKNDYLVKERDYSEYIYFIEEGVVTVESDERVIDFKATSEIIGFQDLMDFNNTNFSYKVFSKNLIAHKFRKIEVIDKVLNTQEGYLYHYHCINREMQELQIKEVLLRKNSIERIKSALIYLLKKFEKENQKSIINEFIELPITIDLLAQYVEMNHVTLYRKLKEMKNQEILYTKKQKIYIDIIALQSSLS
ncbi:Crp/Fnr family transcriptional regulator [Listeria booriae]|uniref:Crp/Fnr family transcriptional regulator n=1 Tax=Listeria booriae TaxID=1552123 RepID=UPI00287FFEB7|nr:Crp/Fnr family transcriptional regulator [Listeria booriae]MDT0110967.1 Crp/Fnr family transcriptional regulator [Listeria booriae]